MSSIEAKLNAASLQAFLLAKTKIMKTIKIMLAAIVLFCTVPVFASKLLSDSSTSTAGKPTTEQLTKRLHELHSIDRSELSRKERRNLRKERKEINKELKAASGGVYISVGVLLLVIILLIILL